MALVNATELRPPFPPQYEDAETFLAAMTAVRRGVQAQRASGLIVPHHLLAADLIALGFASVEAGEVDKVVILFPDHFKRTHLAFATTLRDFDTVFGTIRTERADAARLLAAADLVEASDLFAADHGIGAILPFVKRRFPTATVVPVAVAIGSRQTDWDRLSALLAALVTPRTLVIQSTDFSHYLPLAEAIRHDQETLNVLAAGDLGAAAVLRQPDHVDSRGALYVQMKLQAEVFHARAQVHANANSQGYSDVPQRRTTSYAVATFGPKTLPGAERGNTGPTVVCFAGDTFFGRYIAPALSGKRGEQLRAAMARDLNGCRLVLNLEGVTATRVPSRLAPARLVMLERPTRAWLCALRVGAVGLANNHVRDLGPQAFRRMVGYLRKAGFQVLLPGQVARLGSLRLLAFSDLDNATGRRSGVIRPSDIARLRRVRGPKIALLHWGEEWETEPGERQVILARALSEAGVLLLVGAHPHRASGGLALVDGRAGTLMAYSLGNYLFDQPARLASGAILELRVFSMGTVFARLRPIPNYLDRLRRPVRPDPVAGRPTIQSSASEERSKIGRPAAR